MRRENNPLLYGYFTWALAFRISSNLDLIGMNNSIFFILTGPDEHQFEIVLLKLAMINAGSNTLVVEFS